jgi:1-deoxy-D-xylulose-5-phosphate reductoisomerase
MKRIAILGSTGSIGTQALEVIAAHPDQFSVEVLTANGNVDLLIAQAKKFKPNTVVICDTTKLAALKSALESDGIKVFGGSESIAQLMSMDTIDLVLTAMVGFSGLAPTIAAIENK